MNIDDTQPYNHARPVNMPPTPPPPPSREGPLHMRLEGQLTLVEGAKHQLVTVLDACPDLCHVAELVGDQLRFHIDSLEIEPSRWQHLHRGLCRCGALADRGSIDVSSNDDDWRTTIECGTRRLTRSRRDTTDRHEAPPLPKMTPREHRRATRRSSPGEA